MVRTLSRFSRTRLLGHRSRSRTVAACAALLLVGAAVPQAAANDLRNKQRHVRTQVRSAQGDLQESSQTLSSAARRLVRARTALLAAQGRLSKAQGQVEVAARLDALMQQRLQRAEHQMALARVELDAARQRVIDQRAEIGQLAASNYVNGDPALMGLAVMLNSQDPSEVTSQLNTVDTLMDKQTTLLLVLNQARSRMVTQEVRVEEAKTAVAAQRRAARANLVKKQGLEQVAGQAKTEVATMVARGRAAQAVAARARSADLIKLKAAKRQEDRIQAMILERARRQRGGFKGSAGGFLYRPVPGYVTSPYGYRRHPIFGYWGLHDGADFSAPCGTPIRAVASGTVVAEYSSDVYGNRLFLDLGRVNGKSMSAIYNHLDSYRVPTGARVQRGEVIAYSGTTGWSTACHLHLTVMLDGVPVNPMNYM